MAMTSEQRSLRGQYAVLTRWAGVSDRTAETEPARKAFFQRFEDKVDPNRELPAEERAIRAKAAMRAHMAGLAYASSRKRSERSAGKAAA